MQQRKSRPASETDPRVAADLESPAPLAVATTLEGHHVTAIIVAAGRGDRLGVPAKVLLPLAGRPMLAYVLDAIDQATTIRDAILVVGEHTQDAVRRLIATDVGNKVRTVVLGGQRRQESVFAGLAAIDAATEIVVIHDGARPLASPDLFDRCVLAAAADGAAIAAMPVADTLKQVVDQRIVTTLDRTGVWAAQTPQAFRRALLVDAMAHAGDMATFTDEAALCEALNIPVTIVLGSAANLKVTHPSDVVVANALLRATTSQPDQSPVGGNMETTTGDHSPRVGIGYDVHRFVAGRPLVLGGVTIAYPLGLAGHSDADVLLHAIADALLGAGALGDIGLHFPPSDPRFQDADSRGLLRQVGQLVGAAGFVLIHVDATVVAEAPRIGPHVSAMRAAIGECLGLPETAISIKATTNEGMGFVGRGEGIAALATATIRPRGAD